VDEKRNSNVNDGNTYDEQDFSSISKQPARVRTKHLFTAPENKQKEQ